MMFLFSWLNSLRHHKTTAFFYCEFFGKKLGRKLSLCFKDQIITIAIPARFFMVWFDRHGGNQSQSPCDKDKGGTKLLPWKISKIITIINSARFFILWFYHYFKCQSQSPCDKDKGGTKLSLEKKIQSKIHFLPQNRKIVLVFRWSNSWIQSKREFFVAIFVKIFANFPITTRKKLPFLVFANFCFWSCYDQLKNRAGFTSVLRTMLIQKNKKNQVMNR